MARRFSDADLQRIIAAFSSSAPAVKAVQAAVNCTPLTARRYVAMLTLIDRHNIAGEVSDETWSNVIMQDREFTPLLAVGAARALMAQLARLYRAAHDNQGSHGSSANEPEEHASDTRSSPPADGMDRSVRITSHIADRDRVQTLMESGDESNLATRMRTEHIEALLELAQAIGAFVRDPRHREDEEPYISQTENGTTYGVALAIADDDWSLDPISWMRLSVPDLRAKWKSDWGYLLRPLKHHLKVPFVRDVAGLWHQVRQLDRDQWNTAERVAARYPEFAEEWTRVKAKVGVLAHGIPRGEILPRAPRFGTDRRRWAVPAYEQRDAALVRHWLFKEMPDLYARYQALANGLYRLREDLVPERVYSVVSQTKCDLCRPW